AREGFVAKPAARDVLAHRNAEGIERLGCRVVRPLVLREARHLPGRRQRLLGHLRRALALDPAHETRLMLPEVMGAREHPAVLHPDDLLVHEGARLLPALLEHRLATRSMPAVPGGVLGNRLGNGRRYEAIVEL